MSALLDTVDPDGLLEYSVVYTDRSLNHMSKKFQRVMNDLSTDLKQVYHADAIAIIPGSGTTAMEAVARQLAKNKTCLTLRNGFFNFRWSQIFTMGQIPATEIVLKARPIESGSEVAYAPIPLEEALQSIREQKPDLVFATHVETSSGILLPDDYIAQVAKATHEVGGLFILDCIASGAIWVNMQQLGIDIVTTAPQKGWTASPCAGIVLLSNNAIKAVQNTQSNSFALDLKKWLAIMQSYENGSHAYHATMPTDALTVFRDVIQEATQIGFETLKQNQIELGQKVRALLAKAKIKSLAAEGYEAPGVIVSYTKDKEIHNGKKFAELGIQVASGVPLQCDEPADFQTFRLGLFGLDKLTNIARTVQLFEDALKKVLAD